MWERGEMDVATEHVCTNVAHALVHAVNQRSNGNKDAARVGRRRRGAGGRSVLICTPDGELHGLAAAVIESVLKARGYTVCNAAPSAPAESVTRLIEEVDPDVVMVSVTLSENAGAGERLVKKIKGRWPGRPVLVGGLGTRAVERIPGATVAAEASSTEQVLVAVRAAARSARRKG
jgi:methanogenic corrinoid protein MtbC1